MKKLDGAPLKSPTRNYFVAALALFIVMSAWAVSSPLGSGPDADFHISNIWCAWGEKPGVCENLDRISNDQSARIPHMFLMCNGRPIEYYPACEFDTSHEQMSTYRTAINSQMNLYYRIMRVFVSESPTFSIIAMRLFSSFIAAIMFFLLMVQTRAKTRHAVLAAWSFVLIPVAINYFAAVNPRGWATLGVMSGWGFLQSLFETDASDNKRRLGLIASYVASFALVGTSRADATLFFMFISALIVVGDLKAKKKLSRKILVRYGIVLLGAVFLVQFVPILRNLVKLQQPEGFTLRQYVVFQIVHIPETIGDVWGYTVGQSGSGPGILGIIGLSLFVVAIAFSLQRASRLQQCMVAAISLFTFIAVYRGGLSIGGIAPPTGVYVTGLVSAIMGIAVLFSTHNQQLMSARGNRLSVIALLSAAHVLALYSWMEFYTRRGQSIGYFEKFSLRDAWWWGQETNPNSVFFVGAVFFPVFLIFAWKNVADSETMESLAP
jgi:hypothetical protein